MDNSSNVESEPQGSGAAHHRSSAPRKEGTSEATAPLSPRPERTSPLLDEASANLARRPWQYGSMPPAATDLIRYTLWRSSEASATDLLAALALLPSAKEELESAEVGLIFAARNEGLTWSQIADSMGFRSPQACQQHVARLSTRTSRRQ